MDPLQHTEGPAQAARQQTQRASQAEPAYQAMGTSQAENCAEGPSQANHAKGSSQVEPAHHAKGSLEAAPTHQAKGSSQAERTPHAKGSSQAEPIHPAKGPSQAEPAQQQAQQQVKAATGPSRQDPQKGHQPIAEAAAHQGMHAGFQHPQTPQQASEHVQDSVVPAKSQLQAVSESMNSATSGNKQGAKSGHAAIDIHAGWDQQ